MRRLESRGNLIQLETSDNSTLLILLQQIWKPDLIKLHVILVKLA